MIGSNFVPAPLPSPNEEQAIGDTLNKMELLLIVSNTWLYYMCPSEYFLHLLKYKAGRFARHPHWKYFGERCKKQKSSVWSPRKLTPKKCCQIGRIVKHNHFTTASEMKVQLEEKIQNLRKPIAPMVKHPFKVHVWGAISVKGKIGMHMFTENLDRHLYRQILNEHLYDNASAMHGNRWVFQQDNDPKHTSHDVQGDLETHLPDFINLDDFREQIDENSDSRIQQPDELVDYKDLDTNFEAILDEELVK
ncbi:hypothetical protein C1646_676834 [Rhizophagus diaphanus]|nr:hypothetical protein C1646_676834 [Rhizophagus diaphanus] [Rhizophagus sp. MUCL 43196]